MLVYENVALMSNRILEAFGARSRLPVGSVVSGLFNVFPVFTHREPMHHEIIFEGLLDSAPGDMSIQWVQLPGDDYFPFRRSERRARMQAAGHYYLGGTDAQTAAWRFLLSKVSDRFERTHDGKQLRRVRVCLLSWSRAGRAYDDGRSLASKHVLFAMDR